MTNLELLNIAIAKLESVRPLMDGETDKSTADFVASRVYEILNELEYLIGKKLCHNNYYAYSECSDCGRESTHVQYLFGDNCSVE